MDFTPIDARPIGRMWRSLKRIAMPLRLPSRISSSPLVKSTPISSSPSFKLMAIKPFLRRFANSLYGVFLIMPSRVAITRLCSPVAPGTGTMHVTFSSDAIWMRLIIAVPRAVRPASGIW